MRLPFMQPEDMSIPSQLGGESAEAIPGPQKLGSLFGTRESTSPNQDFAKLRLLFRKCPLSRICTGFSRI